MADFLATKTGKILLIVVLLLLVGLTVWWWRGLPGSEIAGAILLTLIVTTVLWIAIGLAFRAAQRKRQAEFDANVAAKEGIDDRRREWIKWTGELKKHDIDRYALPMYLLVGEPQGGKSVLLHNSDLHFPFGQEKLSGVGGTRGCDWWFTDEAVVLDLAGRLFTHEGGASDEAEWNAFLALLSDFRPYCPANGIILVLPCDGLLTDGEARVSQKVNRMQGALRTLAEKIQARLPVYVVLTKADRIFGFVECFHGLDADQRNEMFGWSRPAEKVDVPFDPQETRAAFDAFVERARCLRAHRLANARIPEALSEVDRLYGFPNELAALWPSLSTYLQRIFGDERLGDKLFFRGFYLTCGLQKGAPIAKVCSELLGGVGESDRRELESLFTKSRAFFIRDLIRKRIFNEKGLVRPTRARVVKVHRAAVIGYGLAGLIALLALVSVTNYFLDRRSEANPREFDLALDAAEAAGRRSLSPAEVLDVLGEIDAAAKIKHGAVGGAMESVFASTANKFKDLYVAVFQSKLVPLMQEGAIQALRHPRHASYEDFKERYIGDVRLITDGGELRDGESGKSDRERLLRLASANPAFTTAAGPEELADRLRAALDTCLEHAGGTLRLPPVDRDARGGLIDAAIASWDRVLEPGADNQVGGQLGYLLAWQGLRDAKAKLAALSSNTPPTDVYALCGRFTNSLAILDQSEADLVPEKEGRSIYQVKVNLEFDGPTDERSEFIRDIGADDGLAKRWKVRDERETFVIERFRDFGKRCQTPDLIKRVLKGIVPSETTCIPVPPGEIKAIREDSRLSRACNAEFLTTPRKSGTSLWDLARLQRDLDLAVTDAKSIGGEHRGVLFAKCLALQSEYVARYQGNDWQKLKADVLGGEGSARAFSQPLSDHFAAARASLAALQAGEPQLAEWLGQVDSLRSTYESALLAEWRDAGVLDDSLVAEVRGHLGARSKIQIAEAADPWVQDVDDWLAGAIRTELNRQKQFWTNIESEPQRGIREAADWFLSQSSRAALAAKLEAARGSFPNLTTLPQVKKDGQTDKLKNDLLAFAPPGGVDSLTNDPFVTRLCDVARRFSAGIDEQQMAAELVNSVQTTQQSNGGRQYVQALFNRFREPVLSILRDRFIGDLKSTVGSHKRLIDALWAELDRDANISVSELKDFFDEGRALDALLNRYHIEHAAPAVANGTDGAAAPPKAFPLEEFCACGASGAPLPAPWSTVRFLIDLQRGLLTPDKEGRRSSEIATFKVSFEPVVKSGELFPEKNPDRPYFYVVSPLITEGGACRIDIKKLGVAPAPCTIEGPLNKALSLAWSKQSSRGPTPDRDDLEVVCFPPLAPLRLAWQGAQSNGKWRVPVRPKGNGETDARATLDITITPPIPERPPHKPFDQ